MKRFLEIKRNLFKGVQNHVSSTDYFNFREA
jgi:hypothetical protein